MTEKRGYTEAQKSAQQRYTEKMRGLDFCPLTVWIPCCDKGKAKKYAKRLRQKHILEGVKKR